MTVEELLYDIALRSLERQERQVAELRARTGTLLAAAALSTSFLGATAVDRAGLSPLVVLAMLALVATIGLCLAVLVPRDLVLSPSLSVIYEAVGADAGTGPMVQLSLAYRLDDVRKWNKRQVTRLSLGSRRAAQVLGADLLLWLAALGVG